MSENADRSGDGKLRTRCDADPSLVADLVAVLRLWPWEVAAMRGSDVRRWQSLIESALRRARRDGLAGHWSYDLGRHKRLVDLSQRLAALSNRSLMMSDGVGGAGRASGTRSASEAAPG